MDLPIPDVSGKRFMVLLAATVIIGLIIASQTVPGLLQVGYGVPTPNGVAVQYLEKTPVSTSATTGTTTKTVTTSGQFFSWSFLKGTYGIRVARTNIFGSVIQDLTLGMDVDIIVKVEVTAPASPTEITSQVVIFKVAEDLSRNVTIFRRSEYHVFSYSFKINTAIGGTINVREISYASSCLLGCSSKEDMAEEGVRNMVSRFNADAYEVATKILWDMNAPTLATVAVTTPGYAGIMGLFLQDYLLGGLTAGTAADMQPQGIGTVVALCLDNTMNCPSNRLAWHLDAPTPTNWIAPEDFVYYPDHFATPYAFWHNDIITLGSTISFQRANRDYPNYWTWAYQASGYTPGLRENCLLPCVAQWFRVDVLELTSTPFEVPNYQISTDQQLRQAILVPDEPFNQGTSSAPVVPFEEKVRLFFLALWNAAKWFIIGFFIILALILIFAILRKIP